MPGELRISNKFVLCNQLTMGVADGTPVFPAIAIPVEKKDQFACPQIVVEQLGQVLRDVSKILVVGWRATERHFLNLLGNKLTGLRPAVQLYLVAGATADAGETNARIHSALLNNPPSSFFDSGGFTGFSRKWPRQIIPPVVMVTACPTFPRWGWEITVQ